MNKRKRLLIIVLVAIVGTFAWTRFATHHAPAGQPPLAYLDPSALETLKADFNRVSDHTRVIALLSPT